MVHNKTTKICGRKELIMSKKIKKRERHQSLDELVARRLYKKMRAGFSIKDCTVKYATGRIEHVKKIYIDWKGKIRIEHNTRPELYCFSRYNPEDMIGSSPKFRIVETEESYILT